HCYAGKMQFSGLQDGRFMTVASYRGAPANVSSSPKNRGAKTASRGRFHRDTHFMALSLVARTCPAQTAMRQRATDRTMLLAAAIHAPLLTRLNVCRLNVENVV